MCVALPVLDQAVVGDRLHLDAVQDEVGGDGVLEIQVPLAQVIVYVVVVCKLASLRREIQCTPSTNTQELQIF